MTKTEQERSVKDALLDPSGPELGDEFLALCGERNRRLVERFSGEEQSERAEKVRQLHQKEHPLIGVLAIQGNYASHSQAVIEAGGEPVEVRKPEKLKSLDGLILPGGESTTMLRFLEKHGFFEALQDFGRNRPVFGTCAGAILLAREVLNPPQRSLGLLDATVERNAYGRQIDSAIVTAPTELGGDPLEMVFIRAPRLVQTGAGVQVLVRRDGFPVLVRQGSILAATFHPELSADRRVHKFFIEMAKSTSK